MADELVFKRVPTLKHLFRRGGLPGVEYALIPPEDLPKAEKAGYSVLNGTTSFYLEGPKGRTAAIVVGRGKPMRGLRPEAYQCRLKVHKELLSRTGLEVPDGSVEGGKGKPEEKEDREGFARVQGGKASLKQRTVGP